MTGTSDNGPSFGRITLTAEERSDAVVEVENLIGRYTEANILCILMTTTINTIHAIEDKRERTRIEEEYIKAFRFLSAVDQQFHGAAGLDRAVCRQNDAPRLPRYWLGL